MAEGCFHDDFSARLDGLSCIFNGLIQIGYIDIDQSAIGEQAVCQLPKSGAVFHD